MWFEILPSFGVVVACLYMPHIVCYVTNRLFLGNAYSRSLLTFTDTHHFLRDMRISGVNDAYVQKNLDSLGPDTDEGQGKS